MLPRVGLILLHSLSAIGLVIAQQNVPREYAYCKWKDASFIPLLDLRSWRLKMQSECEYVSSPGTQCRWNGWYGHSLVRMLRKSVMLIRSLVGRAPDKCK